MKRVNNLNKIDERKRVSYINIILSNENLISRWKTLRNFKVKKFQFILG